MTGDWRTLAEPIDIFVGLPKPLCFVGAAEIMLPLSYLRGDLWGPVGLRKGCASSCGHNHDPEQPDGLIIRVKLLTGYASDGWLRLAEETLALAKKSLLSIRACPMLRLVSWCGLAS